jgi:hypothetical protein
MWDAIGLPQYSPVKVPPRELLIAHDTAQSMHGHPARNRDLRVTFSYFPDVCRALEGP